MTLPKVIGELTPAAFRDVIRCVREKYRIPDPGPDKDTMPEVLAEDIPYEDLREDIYSSVRRQMPEGIPLAAFLKPFLELPADLPLSAALKALAETMPDDLTVGKTVHRYIDGLLEPHIQAITNMLFDYVLTGETTTAPDSWLGGVFSVPIAGQVLIGAATTEYSNLNNLVIEIRRKYHEAFPKKHRKLSHSAVGAAQDLRLKLEGYKLRDIADIYISNHPSEFPKNPLSPQYKDAKRQLEERIKKRIDRLRAVLEQWGTLRRV